MGEHTPEDYAKIFPDADLIMDLQGDEGDVINKVAIRLGVSPEEVRQAIVDAEEDKT